MSRLRHGLAPAALVLILSAVSLFTGGGYARAADDPCSGFGWKVTHERGLFAGKPKSEKAGADLSGAPAIAPEHLYELLLTSQDQVHFSVPPGKKPKGEGAYAGLVRLKVSKAGLYRISVDQPFWIDVVSGAELVRSNDFQGAAGCSAPHKIVLFDLPAAQDLVLQVSGLPSAKARLTVTAAPAGQ
jgi:hypothetical protein